MNVTVIGRTAVLYRSVEAIAEGGHEIDCIVTTDAEPEYDRTAKDFRKIANQLEASFVCTRKINSPNTVSTLRSMDSDVAVSINWKTLIGREVLDSFTHGVLNSHAGDLPRYRGNAAPNWAMLAGEDEVIFTIHQMDEGLDSGPILLQRSYPLTDRTRIGEIYEFAQENVPMMFVEAIEGLASGRITPTPQPKDSCGVLRCYPRIPKDSELQWDKSATHLDRLVRASSEPFEGAYTWLGVDRLIVWRAYAEYPDKSVIGTPGQVAHRRPEAGEVAVLTGEGFLVLEEVETREHGRCDATRVITSHRTRLGMDKTSVIANLADRVQTLESKFEEENS